LKGNLEMDIQVKELEYCKVVVNYKSDEDELKEKEKQIVGLFKKAPIPGNRPGKASTKTIKSYYKKQIEQSLKQAMLEEAVQQTMLQENLKPMANPQFSSVNMDDASFDCEFTLLTVPSFELETYKGFDVVKPQEELTSTDMSEKIIQELRLKHAESIVFDESDFVQKGDNVIIDYAGSCEGVKLDNLCAQAEMFTVGTSLLAEFDEQLVGMKVGEKRQFSIVAPETALPSLLGKTIDFEVELVMASKVMPHALDDALAQKEGLQTFDELKAKVNEIAFGRVAFDNRFKLTKAVAAKIVENHSFKVPDFMSLAEAKALAHSTKLIWEQLTDEDKEKYMAAASKNVKLTLILNKVREEEPDAQLSDAETLKLLRQSLQKSYPGKDLTSVLANMDSSGYTRVMVDRIRDEHTLDFITNSCTVIE
jgi:trigger factor